MTTAIRRALAISAALAVVALGVVLAPDSGAQNDGSERAGSPPPEAPSSALAERSQDPIVAAAEGRAQAGLDGSRRTAERLARDPASVERGRPWGFPVAAHEIDGLVYRFDVQRGSGAVAAKARSLDPTNYSGTWLDLAAGKIYSGYTRNAAQHADELRASARRPDAVEVVEMRYALSQLESAAARIIDDPSLARRQGIEVVSTSIHEPLNAVIVGVESADDATRDELADAYDVDPAALRVEIVPEPENDSAPFGGHALSMQCSAGAFGFTRTSTGAINQRFLVTAAHCGDSGLHHTGGTTSGNLHSPTYTVNLQQEADRVDAQRMLATTAEPTRIVEGWASADFTLDGAASLFGEHDIVGAWVCSAGYATHGVNNCGQINSRSHSCTVAGIVFNNLGRATYTRIGGDSGGTIYGFIFGSSTVPLVGFHKGNCGGAVYSKQTYVRSAMGLSDWDAQL